MCPLAVNADLEGSHGRPRCRFPTPLPRMVALERLSTPKWYVSSLFAQQQQRPTFKLSAVTDPCL